MSSRVTGIRAVILDYGEVICRRPGPARLSLMAAALNLDSETFAGRYHQQRGPYDRGDIDAADYWAKVPLAGIEMDAALLEKLRRWDVEIWSDIDPAMTAWVKRVHDAGFRTALLSNMHPDMAAHARANFDWLPLFDCLILSCEHRLIKPERAIYDRCLEGLGVRPAEALFIDDRETNVAGARDAGLLALRFHSVERLRRDLGSIAFPIPP